MEQRLTSEEQLAEVPAPKDQSGHVPQIDLEIFDVVTRRGFFVQVDYG